MLYCLFCQTGAQKIILLQKWNTVLKIIVLCHLSSINRAKSDYLVFAQPNVSFASQIVGGHLVDTPDPVAHPACIQEAWGSILRSSNILSWRLVIK